MLLVPRLCVGSSPVRPTTSANPLTAVLVVATLAVLACQDPQAPADPGNLTVITAGNTCSPPPCGVLLFALGSTMQFTAAGVDPSLVTWSTTNPAVAGVSANGLVTAVGNGSAAVTAHAGTLSSLPTPVTVAQEVTELEKLAGDTQQAWERRELPVPITVRALDAGGSAIAGATIDFAVTRGDGSVSAEHVVTSAEGQAAVTWIVGVAGEAQEATVSARRMQFAVHPTPAFYPEPSPQTFRATALAGPIPFRRPLTDAMDRRGP
jgi:Big-like domain-containing protein